MKKGRSISAALAFVMAFGAVAAAGSVQTRAEPSSAQLKTLLISENLAAGVRYTEEDIVNYLDNNGFRLRINHVEIDPDSSNILLVAKKAADAADARGSVLKQANEEVDKGYNVIAGINADSFDISSASGISRSLNVYDGCVIQSQPYDNYNKCDPTDNTYYKYQSVLSIDSSGQLSVGPLNSNAHFTAGGLEADATLLNRNDFTFAAQNDCYRAFTSSVTEDHVLRYVNSRSVVGGLAIPQTIRYAVIEIDPVDGVPFEGYVKAGQFYTGTVKEIISTDNFKISDTAANTGTSADEFEIPDNCLVIGGYTTLTPAENGYSDSKAAKIESLQVGETVTYQCDLYSGYGFNTVNNSGALTGVTESDRRTDIVSALADFNTLALNGVANTKNNNEIFKRSPSNTARTMVGIEEDGTVHFLAINSPSASMQDSRGTTYEDVTTYMMDYLNCRDVLAMDGGGSTTMVAKRAGTGSLSVVNYPSDGSQRLVGNSLLVVNTSTETSDTVSQIVIDPSVNLYISSSYQFNIQLTDINGNPIDKEGKEISYSAEHGTIDSSGLYAAPDSACSDTVTVAVDGVVVTSDITVVDSFTSAKVSPGQPTLHLGDTQQFQLTAYDSSQKAVYIDPSLVEWSISDPSIGTMESGVLTVTAKQGQAAVTASLAGSAYTTTVYVGLTQQTVEDFETTDIAAYHLSGYLYGVPGAQRGGQDNNGYTDTYIGYESASEEGSIVKSGSNSLRVTGFTDDWTDRGKNGTMNLYPDWDVAHADIGWTEEMRAQLEESFTAKALPKQFGMWVYSPDSNGDGISDNEDCMLMAFFLQNCPGSKVAGYDSQSASLTLTDSVDWTDWKWVEVDIPQTWDMPVVFNWFCLINTNKAAESQKNEIIVDDLAFLYFIDEPSASVESGTYSSAQTVSLSCDTEGAAVRYTTDGTEPTEGSELYSGPLTISQSTTLKIKAFKPGLDDSATVTYHYVIGTSAPAPSSDENEAHSEIALSDDSTGITISGLGTGGSSSLKIAVLTVSGENLSDAVSDAAQHGTVIAGYDISVGKTFSGGARITIPVGSDYNGRTLTVYHYLSNGKKDIFTCKVKSGKISFFTSSFSPFIIVDKTASGSSDLSSSQPASSQTDSAASASSGAASIPNTGAGSDFFLPAILLLFGCAACGVLAVKKQSR